MSASVEVLEGRKPSFRSAIRLPKLPVDPLGVLGLLIVIGAWWAITTLGLASPMFLPPPAGIIESIRDNFFASPYLDNYHLGGGLYSNIAYTFSNVMISLLVSCIVGVGLGLLSARLSLFRAMIDPVMLTAGTIPILVTAPFFLIWFGTSRVAQTALLIIYGVTILYVFAQRAGDNLDPTYPSAARMLGAPSGRILFDVFLLGTLPEVLGGVRIAMAGSWGLETFSELLGAPHGVGRVIQAMATGMDTQMMIATILALAAVAVACDLIVLVAFGYLTRWRRVARL
ncbi:MAG TPA: ABC transporter permease subunit [Roseiarcus sp.]|jgi:ABC-type nitrate/sulfonate/bicarbonate transport system permease component